MTINLVGHLCEEISAILQLQFVVSRCGKSSISTVTFTQLQVKLLLLQQYLSKRKRHSSQFKIFDYSQLLLCCSAGHLFKPGF